MHGEETSREVFPGSISGDNDIWRPPQPPIPSFPPSQCCHRHVANYASHATTIVVLGTQSLPPWIFHGWSIIPKPRASSCSWACLPQKGWSSPRSSVPSSRPWPTTRHDSPVPWHLATISTAVQPGIIWKKSLKSKRSQSPWINIEVGSYLGREDKINARTLPPAEASAVSSYRISWDHHNCICPDF